MIKNIHCLALNYKNVGKDNQDPLYFLKSTSCITNPGGIIPWPHNTSQVWTEVELGIIISKTCINVNLSDAHQYIKGFIVAGDVTCNNVYDRDHHLALSKARTGFCPVNNNPVYVDLRGGKVLKMETQINGNTTQIGTTADMKFNPYQSISYLSKIITLQENDLIITGTPSGGENNIIHPNDKVKHIIEGVGELNYSFGSVKKMLYIKK